jgi:hypothetical protein
VVCRLFARGVGFGLHLTDFYRRADEIARLVLVVFGSVDCTLCAPLIRPVGHDQALKVSCLLGLIGLQKFQACWV